MENVTPDKIFEYITAKLSWCDDPPKTMFGLGIWLAANTTNEGLNALCDLEDQVGQEEANKLLVAAMVKSGKYRDAGKGTVERI